MKPGTLKTLAAAAMMATFLTSCGSAEQEETAAESSGGSRTTGGESSVVTEPSTEGSEMSAMETTAASDEATVGGFTVESPDGGEISVPEVAVDPQEAEAYLRDVRPVVEDSVRDISGLVEPEVGIEDGNVSLDLNVRSLDEARRSIENGADGLRELQPPDGLEGINDQLIEAYEEAVPAYQSIADAAEGGDPQEITNVVRQSLGDIERFDNEVEAILQDVEQAADER